MEWKIILLDEYEDWFDELDEKLQDAIYEDILVLEKIGPGLGRPHVDTLNVKKGTKKIKELRTEFKGQVYRSLFAFDPKQSAVFLLGGNKSGKNKWYDKNIPKAQKRYKKHLESIKKK